MAKQNTPKNASKQRKPLKQAASSGGKQPKKRATKPTSSAKQKQAEQPRFFDDRMRRDIAGVVCGILAIALFITAIITPNGVVTSALNTALFYGLGVGTYILPFVLLGISITFLVRFDREMMPLRAGIGLALIFLAILTLISMFTPGAESNPGLVFSAVYLQSHGGFVGGGLAWTFLTLFGLTVSIILQVGIIIVAIVIIGFSISGLIESIRAKHVGTDETFEGEEREGARISLPFKHMLKGREKPVAKLPEAEPVRVSRSAKTRVIGEKAPTPRKRLAAPDVREAKTMVLNDDEPVEKPLTRKLGSTKPRKNVDEAKTLVLSDREAKTTKLEDENAFKLPNLSILKTSPRSRKSAKLDSQLQDRALILEETLADFNVNARVVDWIAGPTVTLFEVDLPSGVRVSKIQGLQDDIALAMASPGVRIFAPVPGTNYVGIEIPNTKRQNVLLGDILADAPSAPLQIAIGKDVEGNAITADLAKMPHLLIGGTTGSGKSVAINGMIMSILMRTTPEEVRFIMIDPKRVEFAPYDGIPNLYVPVVTESREAASALAWAVAEMERRLKVFSKVGCRNIGEYNSKAENGLEIEGNTAEKMPYIVIVIDELADLMMNVGKEVEFSIARLAQLARAAGIHMIIATQRPSTNVVTGLIKANITSRIALSVASSIDSRVILDTTGAEHLIGNGDLLFSQPEFHRPLRIQGCFVSGKEISEVVEKLKAQGEPEYHNDILSTNLVTLGDSAPDGSGGSSGGGYDPRIWEAAEIVCASGMGSTSNIQRRLSIGYTRAGRIMDQLEELGIVGPQNGSKPREVLVDPLELESIKALESQDD